MFSVELKRSPKTLMLTSSRPYYGTTPFSATCSIKEPRSSFFIAATISDDVCSNECRACRQECKVGRVGTQELSSLAGMIEYIKLRTTQVRICDEAHTCFSTRLPVIVPAPRRYPFLRYLCVYAAKAVAQHRDTGAQKFDKT